MALDVTVEVERQVYITFRFTVPYHGYHELTTHRLNAFQDKVRQFAQKELADFMQVLRFDGEIKGE